MDNFMRHIAVCIFFVMTTFFIADSKKQVIAKIDAIPVCDNTALEQHIKQHTEDYSRFIEPIKLEEMK